MKYLKGLLIHKWYVFLAGIKAGVPIWRLIVHDWQKFTKWEYRAYSQYNFGSENAKKVQHDFNAAWLHHENTAPHHWGYWIPRSGQCANEPLPMPETYVREMIADWHGAEKAYQGKWDISEWVHENCPKMRLHDDTVELIHNIMNELDYLPMHGHSASFDFAPQDIMAKVWNT